MVLAIRWAENFTMPGPHLVKAVAQTDSTVMGAVASCWLPSHVVSAWRT